MFCPECGRKNDDSAVFCEKCGTRLKDAVPKESVVLQDREKNSLFAANKILIIELGVILLSVIIFAGVYNTRFSAKSTAERYVKAMYEGDWNAVYDTLLIEGSGEFMTKEAFITAKTLEQETIDTAETDIMGAEKKSGGFFKAKYTVQYDILGGEGSTDVKLKRKGLAWKVDTEGIESYVVEKYAVLVPSGAKVTIDKIEVPGKLKVEERKQGFDTYEIPEIFGNTHYVEIKGENLEKTGQIVTGYSQEDLSGTECIVSTIYNKETVGEVMKLAEADLGEILNAAASNKRFSEIDVFEKMSEENKENTLSSYDYLRNNTFENGNSGNALLKYQITNGEIKGKAVGDAWEGISMIQVELSGQYYLEKQYTGWMDEKYTEDYSGTCNYELSYINEGDTWKLYDMDMDSLY